MKDPTLTIGIEEEYQIIDPETRELRSYITEILKEDSVVLGEVKPELHQSMVEVGGRQQMVACRDDGALGQDGPRHGRQPGLGCRFPMSSGVG